jgi:uncharacterized protein (TIGR03437 family)
MLVQPDTTGLVAGVYFGALTLVFEDRSVRTVTILLVLAPGGTSQDTFRSAVGCSPSKLLPVLTTLGQDFSVAAAWPVTIVARIVDDCGRAVTTGSAVSSFDNGDPPLSLAPVGDGSWSATWASRRGLTGLLSVTVNAETGQPKLRGTVTVTGALLQNPNPPVVAPGGVVSAASSEGEAPLAPGSIVSIYGKRLADSSSLADHLPLDVRMAGTEIFLAGRSLPLYYASDGQVNAIVPFGLEVNTSHQLIVSRGNTLSVPEPITMAAARPGVFLAGSAQGHVYRFTGNTYTLADAQNPLRAGDVIVIFCAGLGGVNAEVNAGHAAPGSPPAAAMASVAVPIGGRTANILFAGLTPGSAGLYQINAIVPDGIARGNEVPLVVTAAGQAGPAVAVAVQ